jgi:hypothetical protein
MKVRDLTIELLKLSPDRDIVMSCFCGSDTISEIVISDKFDKFGRYFIYAGDDL